MTDREFSIPIAGAAFLNADGSNRLFAIRTCSPGDPIELRAEPTNKFDPAAIAVLNGRGEQLGYLPAERAHWIGSKLREHGGSAIFQHELTAGAAIRIRIGEGAPTLPAPHETEVAREDWDAIDPDGPEWGA